jgi:guanine nucleotide-binding protein G(i) subunit alpha
MKCGNRTSDEDPEFKRNKEITKQVKIDAKNNKRIAKILLLGTGDSGKSTFVKQMKVIHRNNFSEQELCGVRNSICTSCIEAMKDILTYMKSKKIEGITDKHEKYVTQIKEANKLSPEIGKSLQKIWKLKSVQKFLPEAQRDLPTVTDSLKYFYDDITRIAAPNYTPTVDDIIRAKIKTSGIYEFDFLIKESHLKLIDVGGQRSERRKWLHCFDGVTAIIYIAALNEYDMKLAEDAQTNRMQESLHVFQQLSQSQWLREIPFLLFLNKCDLLKEKLQFSSIKKSFPEYTGGDTDYNAVISFVEEKYRSMFEGKILYKPYVTCALDTENVKRVFNAVHDIVFKSNLTEVGLLEE